MMIAPLPPMYEDPEMQKHVRKIMNEFGDPSRPGTLETPRRYLKFLQEFMNPESFEITTFEAENYDQMIIVKDIPFYSLCEHHLVPFFGTAAIAYIPNDKIVGLSKLPRILDASARAFQNQERITMQVVSTIDTALQPKGVACVITARHMCMEMRGIKKPGAQTVTSAFRGCFNEASCRAEFMSLLK